MQNNKSEKKKAKETGTDAIINNLMNPDHDGENGNLINDKGNASFSNINTSIYGVEVDVDDL